MLESSTLVTKYLRQKMCGLKDYDKKWHAMQKRSEQKNGGNEEKLSFTILQFKLQFKTNVYRTNDQKISDKCPLFVISSVQYRLTAVAAAQRQRAHTCQCAPFRSVCFYAT